MRRTLVMVAVLAVAATAPMALAWGLQRRLTYLPAGAPPPVEQVLPGAREVTLRTDDGLDLAAWYLPAGAAAVLVLPGNAGHRGLRAPLARALADRGLTVLLVDYRSYGGNPGRPTEDGLAADAETAATWLRSRSEVERTVYLGESLGAAVAVRLAGEHPPDALILRSPFPSLVEVARVHYGPVPEWLLRDRYRVADRVRALDVPVLVVAGDADRIVPPEHSRRVFEAAGGPKRFVAVPGAGHNDPALLDGDRFIEAVAAFLRDHDLLDG